MRRESLTLVPSSGAPLRDSQNAHDELLTQKNTRDMRYATSLARRSQPTLQVGDLQVLPLTLTHTEMQLHEGTVIFAAHEADHVVFFPQLDLVDRVDHPTRLQRLLLLRRHHLLINLQQLLIVLLGKDRGGSLQLLGELDQLRGLLQGTCRLLRGRLVRR